MSRYQGLKFKNLLTVFLICGAFLFVSQANALNNYAKEYNGTLTAAEWNGLFSDFVNTMLPVRMNGPLGINTAAPTNPIFLDVNGTVQASAFLGPITGTISAANVSSGAFGGNTGGGNYSFPGNVGIGTTNPVAMLDVTKLLTQGATQDMLSFKHDGSWGLRLVQNFSASGNMQYDWVQKESGTDKNVMTFQHGNVGIGTTNPGANLHVQGAAANYISKFQSTADDNFNQFISATGIGEYGIWGDSLYFQALDNLANGIRFYGGSSSRVDLQIINSGNVGIGATNPEAKLHISGGALMLESGSASFITGFGKSLIYSSSGGGSYPFDRWGNLIIQPRTTLASDIVFAAGTTPSVRMVIKDSGSVGIGTTTPATTLDVNGLIKMRTSTILSSEDVVNKGYLDSALASTTSGIITQVATSSFWQGSLTGSIYNANTGNVGIGTSNPAAKLEVMSDATHHIQIGGPLNVGNSEYAVSMNWESNKFGIQAYHHNNGYDSLLLNPNGGNVGIGTTAPTGKLTISDNSALVLDTQNDLTKPFIGFGSYWNGSTIVAQGGSYYGMAIEGTRGFPIANSKIDFSIGGSGGSFTKLVTIRGDGNVGIGTTAPNDKFSIGFGGSAAPAGSDSTGHNYANTYLSTDDYALANYGLVKTLIAGGSGSSVGYWTMSGTNIYSSNSGNVGIGTTAPGYKLDVVGSTRIKEGASTMAFNEYNGGATLWLDGIDGDFSGGDYYNISANNSGNLAFGKGGGENMTMTSAGNFGIGKTDPATALDVNGTVTASAFSGPLSGTISSQNVSAGEFGKNTGGGNFIFGATVPGNVGIGMTNPGAKLDVSGSIKISNAGNYLTFGNASYPLYVGDGTSLLFYPNNNERYAVLRGDLGVALAIGGTPGLFLNTSGNVGIGTTDPGAYKLKVAGDVAITGALLTQTGSDFAEEFKAPQALEAGTVVIMGDEGYKSVKACYKGYDKTVVGIVSDNPSIIAGRTDIDNKNPEKVIVAMMGVVSVKVSDINGSIEKGDLLVSSGISGYAMKSIINRPGTVIGKALENLTGKTGKIKVLVNLQ